jgi:tetratricopeptide (TPR) repeat protein
VLRDAPCARSDQRASAHFQLAMIALLAGDTERALASLEAARAEGSPTPELLAWSLDVEGRALLARGDPRGARARFAELAERAERAAMLDAQRRAAIGEGRALEALGRFEEAVAAYRVAEGLLERELESVPLDRGRAAFAGQRGESARRLVALLSARDRAVEALDAHRRARGRALAMLAGRARVEALGPGERSAFEAALADYQRARTAREQATREAWAQPLDERSPGRAGEPDAAVAEREALDRALATAHVDRGAGPPELPPGEAYLAIAPVPGGWIAIASRDGRARSIPVGRAGQPLAEIARAAVIESRAVWEGATALALAVGGALAAIDVHGMVIDDAPLAARIPVRYALDVATAAPSQGERALVVVDPRGDLAGAREEGATIAALSPVWSVLRGDAATREALVAAMPALGALHLAGHGSSADAEVESALLLAGEGSLTAGDVLALGAAPQIVVLSACEGAAEARPREVLGLGVAQAFVLAGAERVVAASRALPDASAREHAVALWQAIGRGASAERALGEVARAAHARGDASWSALRVLSR